MATVTLPGANGTTISETYTNSSQSSAQIAALLDAAVASLVSGQAFNETLAAGSTYDLTIGAPFNENITTDGSGTINAGFGNTWSRDIAVVGAGSTNLIFTTGNGGTVFLGAGAATVGVTGLSNVIDAGGNSAVIADGGSGDEVNVGAGNATIFASGIGGAYSTGSGNTVIIGGQGSADIQGVELGSGATTINAGPANFYVYSGPGSLTFIGGAGTSTINGGPQTPTVFGGAGGEIDYVSTAGEAGGLLVAGSGNETLSAAASATNDTLYAGSGADKLVAGSGNDTIVAGTGAATMTGGSGNDVFGFFKGQAGGTDVIAGATPKDLVALYGYGGTAAIQTALSTATTTFQGTAITLSDNTSILFAGATNLYGINFYSA